MTEHLELREIGFILEHIQKMYLYNHSILEFAQLHSTRQYTVEP